MVDKAKVVFDSYNVITEKCYDEMFSGISEEEVFRLKEENVDSILNKCLAGWEQNPISELGGISPKEYINSFERLDQVMELFKLAAKMCDRDVPQLILGKLAAFGDKAIDELLNLAGNGSMLEDEDNFLIPLIAVRTAGALRAEKAVGPLIDLIYCFDETRESMVEEICDALVAIGTPAIKPMLEVIERSEQIGYVDEYILNALVRTGKYNKSDKIFRCLKQTFLRMEDKILGALCLGDYGDGRAIPALRGFIEKNKDNIDKAVLYEVAAAVKRLGGNVEDLI